MLGTPEAIDLLSDEKWLLWFLNNHSLTALVALGVWKRPGLIVSDLASRDGEIPAVRAAHKLGGIPAALEVVGELLSAEAHPAQDEVDMRKRDAALSRLQLRPSTQWFRD